MKANELRLGNYITQVKYRNGKCNEVRLVRAIRQEGFLNVRAIENQTIRSLPIEWFKPILLTKEWLLRLGFNKVDGINYIICFNEFNYNMTDYKKDYFILSIGSCSDFSWEYTSIAWDIKYVHQLQNIYFALVGEELIFSE